MKWHAEWGCVSPSLLYNDHTVTRLKVSVTLAFLCAVYTLFSFELWIVFLFFCFRFDFSFSKIVIKLQSRAFMHDTVPRRYIDSSITTHKVTRTRKHDSFLAFTRDLGVVHRAAALNLSKLFSIGNGLILTLAAQKREILKRKRRLHKLSSNQHTVSSYHVC